MAADARQMRASVLGKPQSRCREIVETLKFPIAARFLHQSTEKSPDRHFLFSSPKLARKMWQKRSGRESRNASLLRNTIATPIEKKQRKAVIAPCLGVLFLRGSTIANGRSMVFLGVSFERSRQKRTCRKVVPEQHLNNHSCTVTREHFSHTIIVLALRCTCPGPSQKNRVRVMASPNR